MANWKLNGCDLIQLPSQIFPRRTKKNQKTTQSQQSVSRPIFEASTSGTQVQSVTSRPCCNLHRVAEHPWLHRRALFSARFVATFSSKTLHVSHGWTPLLAPPIKPSNKWLNIKWWFVSVLFCIARKCKWLNLFHLQDQCRDKAEDKILQKTDGFFYSERSV